MPSERPPPLAQVTTTRRLDWCHTRATPTAVPPPPKRPHPHRPRRWHGDLLRSEPADPGKRARDAAWRVGSSETIRGSPLRNAAQWPPPLDVKPTPPQRAFSLGLA